MIGCRLHAGVSCYEDTFMLQRHYARMRYDSSLYSFVALNFEDTMNLTACSAEEVCAFVVLL